MNVMPRTNERSFHCEEVRQKYFKQNRGHDDSLVPTISQRQFQALMTKLDRLENKLEILISKVIEEVNNGNKPNPTSFFMFSKSDCGKMHRM